MTRVVGPELSAQLVERFSQRDLPRRLGIAIPFVTVDAEMRPHPMLLSYLEVRAYDTRTVGLVIGARGPDWRRPGANRAPTGWSRPVCRDRQSWARWPLAVRTMKSANAGNGSKPRTSGAFATKFDVAFTS